MYTTSSAKEKKLTLCYYENKTQQIQIGRISNISAWFFERVIFPGQRMIFEAPLEAKLEIYTGEIITAMLKEKISCDRLQINSFLNYRFPN